MQFFVELSRTELLEPLISILSDVKQGVHSKLSLYLSNIETYDPNNQKNVKSVFTIF